jgi:hypothetical protein
MASEQKKEDFFESIAPKVQNSTVMITTKDQIKKTAFGRWGLLFFLLFILTAAGFYYFYSNYKGIKSEYAELKKQSGENTGSDSDTTLARIGKHILIPEDEQPAVVTITDVENFRKLQPLYQKAKNGDQLVTFKEMQIIYDPSADIIVSVRNLQQTSIQEGSMPQATQSQAQTSPVSLDIRNGAAVAGLAGKTAEALGKEATYKIASVGNAQKQIYTKNVIVNLKGKDVSNLEERFGVKAVSQLPTGESGSTADVVLILGK